MRRTKSCKEKAQKQEKENEKRRRKQKEKGKKTISNATTVAEKVISRGTAPIKQKEAKEKGTTPISNVTTVANMDISRGITHIRTREREKDILQKDTQRDTAKVSMSLIILLYNNIRHHKRNGDIKHQLLASI